MQYPEAYATKFSLIFLHTDHTGMADRRHPAVGDRLCSREDLTASFGKHTKAAQAARLPAPLTEAVLCEARKELSEGARGSLEQCVACYSTHRMSAADLLSCIKMMAPLSKTFTVLFQTPAKPSTPAPNATLNVVEEEETDDMSCMFVLSRASTEISQDCGEQASPDDMTVLMAMGGVSVMPAPAQPAPWEREKNELLERYNRLVLFDQLIDSKMQELRFDRLIESKTREEQCAMPVKSPAPQTPPQKERHHGLMASQALAKLIDLKMQLKMKADTSLCQSTNSAKSDTPFAFPQRQPMPTRGKVTLKGVATQVKGTDAVLSLSGGSLSLVVVGGGGGEENQTLLSMPFSCVLLEPVLHHDTCIHLKAKMKKNSSAGACDTVVIVLPSRSIRDMWLVASSEMDIKIEKWRVPDHMSSDTTLEKPFLKSTGVPPVRWLC